MYERSANNQKKLAQFLLDEWSVLLLALTIDKNKQTCSTLPSCTSMYCDVTTVKSALIICNSTPSSVCGPLKQLHIVDTIRSIRNRPGFDESGIFPVKWPYAMSFCRQSSAVTTMRGVLLWHANSNGRKYFSAFNALVESFFGNGKAVDCPSIVSICPPSFNCLISPAKNST